MPGTSASAAYFAPLAQDILSKTKDWQVWSVERRENLFEDHSMVDRAKRGEATVQQVFDYYLELAHQPCASPTISSWRSALRRSFASGECGSPSRTCGR